MQRSESVRTAICALPQTAELVEKYLSDYPDWQHYLQPLLKQGLDPIEAFSRALVEKPTLSIPELITSRLVQLPDVRQLVTVQIASWEGFRNHFFDSLELNMHQLRELQAVVHTNLANLPNLQGLLREHYLSEIPVLKDYQVSLYRHTLVRR